MRLTRFSAATALALIFTQSALAETMWLQIEANPSLAQGQQVAREWGQSLPNVVGFSMNTGMYAIAVGPFASREEADAQRVLLRGQQVIPADSYVTDGTRYAQQFWPVGAQLTVAAPTASTPPAPVEPELPVDIQAAPEVTPAQPPAQPIVRATPEPIEETAAEARASERALNSDERKALQEALAWQGFYTAGIDGSFGAGTRNSMAAWQAARGFEPTGILTTRQRTAILAAVANERAALGLSTVSDTEAGIEIDLPLGLVQFDHYNAPFATYNEVGGSGVQVLLISQSGDQNRLFGLYDVMETLEIVPLEGPRERNKSGFTLTGSNAEITSHTEVSLRGGLIKGFTLIYPTAKAPQMERVLQSMQATFKPVGNIAMDDTLGQPLRVEKADLMSGLDVRRPVFGRSGFYIDAKGTVATAGAGLDQCHRVTVDNVEADIKLNDPIGIALLTPKAALAPAMFAAMQTEMPRLNADIAAAGFSYGGALSSPVVSFGQFSAAEGLAGEMQHARLTLATRDGDAGGPVMDAAGGVIGMVLPQDTGSQVLPDDLTVALQAPAMAPALAAAGHAPAAAEPIGSLAPEDLSAIARAITVQVSCWN
jgi:peptidoglycan hydrolase-like protein with peptidoglycan-binding domain